MIKCFSSAKNQDSICLTRILGSLELRVVWSFSRVSMSLDHHWAYAEWVLYWLEILFLLNLEFDEILDLLHGTGFS